MHRRFGWTLLCVLFVPLLASAEDPVPVSMCDLMRNPTGYDMRTVQLRGLIDLQFENFTVIHPSCGTELISNVWLTLGGDESTPAIYCCGDHRRPKGSTFKVRGRSVALVRDANFEEFKSKLLAERLRRPDGESCYGRECYFYDVTATLTGLFVGGDTTPGMGSPGYGHFGCCHLLVIQKVTDIVAQRTQAPAGGQFECKPKEWSVRLSEIGEWPPESTERDDYIRKLLASIARQRQDDVDISRGTLSCWTDATQGASSDQCNWTAANLLTSYALKRVAAYDPDGLLVSRRKCEYTSANRRVWPADASIRCDSYVWQGGGERSAPAVLQRVHRYKETWRLLNTARVAEGGLARALHKWGISKPTSPVRCSDPDGNDEIQVAGCDWLSPEQMSDFYVVVQKFSSARKHGAGWDDVPWVVTEASATVCRVRG